MPAAEATEDVNLMIRISREAPVPIAYASTLSARLNCLNQAYNDLDLSPMRERLLG